MKKILGTTVELALMKRFLKLFSVALIAGLAAPNAHAWTITVRGTIYNDQPFTGHGGPFGENVSLIGLPYSMTITTNPLLNEYVDSDTPTYHHTYGGTNTAVGAVAAAPYTITVVVNGVRFIQTEPFPAYNRSYLSSHPVSGEDSVYQEINSNACSWSYGLCVVAYIVAWSNIPFLNTLDFNQVLKLSDRTLDPGSRAYFAFRNGSYLPGSIQQNNVFYGSISDLSIKHDPKP